MQVGQIDMHRNAWIVHAPKFVQTVIILLPVAWVKQSCSFVLVCPMNFQIAADLCTLTSTGAPSKLDER